MTSISYGGSERIEYIYDPEGNIVKDIRTISGNKYITAYEYNDANKLAAIQYPSGRIVDYERLNAVVDNVKLRSSTTVIASGITYAPFGPLTDFQYGNKLPLKHTYDAFYRVDLLSSGSFLSLDYDYSKLNIDLVTDTTLGPRSQDFGYTGDDRLSTASGNYGSFIFGYDMVGNRTSLDWQNGSQEAYRENYNYPLDTQNNLVNQRLDSISGAGVGSQNRNLIYNANGSLTNDNNLVYSYDDSGRLISAKKSGILTAAYQYNPLGQRERKITSKNERQYVYGLDGQLLYEVDPNSNWQRDYIYLDGRLIAFAEEAI